MSLNDGLNYVEFLKTDTEKMYLKAVENIIEELKKSRGEIDKESNE